jgi:NAD(P)-dependent dehydrogenase (short-subunit alcohol dehydrogenase family)
MPTVLIAGANRGIGLEFVQQYVRDGWTVIGTARSTADCAETAAAAPGVRMEQLEVTSQASIDALANRLAGVPIDILIVNAGISGDLPRKPVEIDFAELETVMSVNTFAPLHVAAALRPNLEAGERKVAVAVSSLMSSITRNTWGTQYVYRASKTALNAMWTSLAREWKPLGISCILIRPGLVRTRMTNFKGDLDPEESVSGMRRVLDRMTIADSGRLIGYDGLDLPW